MSPQSKPGAETDEFNDKRILVNNFVMAFAQFAMNFHAKTNQFAKLLLYRAVLSFASIRAN